LPALTSAHEGATQRAREPEPGTPAAIGWGWLVALFAGCAVYAGGVALLSSSVVERPWGAIAAPGYALAAVAAAWGKRSAPLASTGGGHAPAAGRGKRRAIGPGHPGDADQGQRGGRRKRWSTDAALLLSLCGGLLVPLGWLSVQGVQQREVNVISRGAWLLIHTGTPYRSVATLAHTHNPDAYNPYLPAMEVFALARAVWGNHPLTDPRLAFAAAFAVVFWLALRGAGTPHSGRWTALIAATPVFAFPLAVSGDDVPVVALLCLGLALLAGPPGGAPRPVPAGLAFGIAAAMKATAWPALLIAAFLVAARDGTYPAGKTPYGACLAGKTPYGACLAGKTPYGRRAALGFAAAALATFAVLVGPVAAVSPAAFADNTILFPLGLASVKSGAVSPLPGVLLSQAGPAGPLVATVLLALAGLGIVASLVIRPPRTARAAAWRLIAALVLMFTLAPSSRFGYYIYPLGLWIWLAVTGADRRPGRIPLCG
jgi:hypothetical protein